MEKMGEADVTWHVQRMKNRWNSCTLHCRRILFNIKLARVPQSCIEYIVVHELLHLKEKNHNKIFEALLNKYLPDWLKRRE
jgi:predicted metal-dependent hydrolase